MFPQGSAVALGVPGGVTIRSMAATSPARGMHGRDAETRALADALDRAAGGRLAVVLIEGEAGIGKTRLLARALADASSRRMQVVAGRAEELEQALHRRTPGSRWLPPDQGVLPDYARGHVVADDDPARLAADVPRLAEASFALLEDGLRGYPGRLNRVSWVRA